MSGAKVLLVDDDEDYRNSMKPLLENEGYTVVEACSGRDALKMVKSENPDVIVLDVMMDYLDDGYGVTQAIRFQDEYLNFRKIPIIMVSSITDAPAERFRFASESQMIEPDYYMTKPVDIDRFLAMIDRMLKARAKL